MKVLLLFSLFAVVASEDLTQYRVRNAIAESAMKSIVQRFDDDDGDGAGEFSFAMTVDNRHRGTVFDALGQTHAAMDGIVASFGAAAREFFNEKLLSHCRHLYRLIKNAGVAQDVAQDVVDRARLGEGDLCAFSFLFHLGVPTDDMFGISLVLHLLAEATRPGVLSARMKAFVDNYYDEVEKKMQREPAASDEADEADRDALLARLARTRKSISDTSRKFCDPSVPRILLKQSYFKGEIDLTSSSPFLAYMDRTERFFVDFISNTNPSGQVAINSWNTFWISGSPEYRISEYMEQVKVDRGTSKSRLEQPWVLQDETDKDISDLKTLRGKLTSNDSHYFNLVKYSNVLFEVALFVSMKEGKKILQVAKHLYEKRCAEHRTVPITSKEVFRIWTKLNDFKVKFDRLAKSIGQSVPLDESTKDAENAFRDAMNLNWEKLTLPDVLTDDYFFHVLCANHEAFLVLKGYDQVVVGKKSNERLFNEYYLNDPPKHVGQLENMIAQIV